MGAFFYEHCASSPLAICYATKPVLPSHPGFGYFFPDASCIKVRFHLLFALFYFTMPKKSLVQQYEPKPFITPSKGDVPTPFGLYAKISPAHSNSVQYYYYTSEGFIQSDMHKGSGCKISIQSFTQNQPGAVEYTRATPRAVVSNSRKTCTESKVSATKVRNNLMRHPYTTEKLAVEIASNLFPCHSCRSGDYKQKFLDTWGVKPFLQAGYPHLATQDPAFSTPNAQAQSAKSPDVCGRSSSSKCSPKSSPSSRLGDQASPPQALSSDTNRIAYDPPVSSPYNYCWILTREEQQPNQNPPWYATCVTNVHPTKNDSTYIKNDPGLFCDKENQVNGTIAITYNSEDIAGFTPLFEAKIEASNESREANTPCHKALDELTDEHVLAFLRRYTPGPSGSSGGSGGSPGPSGVPGDSAQTPRSLHNASGSPVAAPYADVALTAPGISRKRSLSSSQAKRPPTRPSGAPRGKPRNLATPESPNRHPLATSTLDLLTAAQSMARAPDTLRSQSSGVKCAQAETPLEPATKRSRARKAMDCTQNQSSSSAQQTATTEPAPKRSRTHSSASRAQTASASSSSARQTATVGTPRHPATSSSRNTSVASASRTPLPCVTTRQATRIIARTMRHNRARRAVSLTGHSLFAHRQSDRSTANPRTRSTARKPSSRGGCK
jgi:hypothetical protein